MSGASVDSSSSLGSEGHTSGTFAGRSLGDVGGQTTVTASSSSSSGATGGYIGNSSYFPYLHSSHPQHSW